MSETASVSVGSQSSSPSSSQSNTQSQSAPASQSSNTFVGAQGQGQSPNPNAQGGAQHESQTQNEPQTPRKLGNSDMDALVTVKIDGKTQELPLKEIIKLQQLEQVSRQKMQKAAEMERRAQEMMNGDLEQFAKLKNLNLDQIAEERLARAYEMAQMTPEQRRLHELEGRESQRQQHETQFKSQIIEQIKNFAPDLPQGIENATPQQLEQYLGQVKQVYTMTEQNLEREFVDAWKQTGLPKTHFIGAQMAFMARNGKNDNGEPLQIPEAAAKVKEAYVNDLRGFVGQMDAQAIHDMLGKDVIQKIRDFDIQRVTGQTASKPVRSDSPGNQPASSKKTLNEVEWRKAMGLS